MKLHHVIVAAAIALGTTAANASAANIVTNGDFENINIGTSNYYYPGASTTTGIWDGATVAAQPSYAGWNWSGGAGVINAQGSNAWYGGSSPTGFSGDQYAFVQTGGSFSQTFSVANAETASISWLSGSRPDFGGYDGTTSYEVLLNGQAIDTVTTASDQNFSLVTIAGLNLVAGTNTLTFQNLSTSGDHTAFLDNVSVSAVPLPGAVSLFGTALLGMGAFARRRAKKTAA